MTCGARSSILGYILLVVPTHPPLHTYDPPTHIRVPTHPYIHTTGGYTHHKKHIANGEKSVPNSFLFWGELKFVERPRERSALNQEGLRETEIICLGGARKQI